MIISEKIQTYWKNIINYWFKKIPLLDRFENRITKNVIDFSNINILSLLRSIC